MPSVTDAPLTSHSTGWRVQLIVPIMVLVLSALTLGLFAVRMVTSSELHIKVQCRDGLGLPGDDKLARSTDGRVAGGVWVDDSMIGLLLTDHRGGVGCSDARGSRALEVVGVSLAALIGLILAIRTWGRRVLLGFSLVGMALAVLMALAAIADGPVLPVGLGSAAAAVLAVGAWQRARSL